MKRRLVKHGASTMMISLPSKWIKNFNLGKGDELDVEEKGKELIITTEKELEQKNKAVIDITGYSPLVNRIMISLFVKGLDELEVKFKDKREIEDFQKRVINELLGFEIMKQTNNSLLLRDISGVQLQEVNDIIKRIFFIIDSMAEELVIALEKDQSLDPVIDTDTSVNRFCHFCLRILNKKGYTEFNQTPQVYGIVSRIEEAGDIIKRIAKDSKKIKPRKEYIEIIKDLKSQIKLFKDLFFSHEKKELIKFSKDYEKIKEKIKQIKQKTLIDFHLFDLNETIIKMNNLLMVILPFY